MLTTRDLHLLHRWMGIGVGIAIPIWFLSGLIMLFVSRPALVDAERLIAMPKLGTHTAFVSPLAAWRSLGQAGWPEAVRLNAANGQPSYHFLEAGRWSSVRASDGMPLMEIRVAEAAETALRLVPGAEVEDVVSVDRDQWTLSRSFDAWRPFLRVELDNGQDIYISSRTGEAILDTSIRERALNWAGSVIHWLYFTPIRQQAELWRVLVLVLSFVALLLAASGIWLGFQRLRIRRRYSEGRVSPYRDGLKKWHHLLGLAGGSFILLWLFSGWLSMSPFGLAAGVMPSEQDYLQFAGGPLSGDVLDWQASWPDNTRELDWLRIGGEAVIRQRGPQSENRIVWRNGAQTPALTLETIKRAAKQLRPESQPVVEWLHVPDQRYYPLRHDKKTFPVARVRFNDARNSVFYIDPESASIAMLSDRTDSPNRWLFLALHRLDFPVLVTHPLLRDLLVILFSLLGGSAAMAGCVLGWRRLTR